MLDSSLLWWFLITTKTLINNYWTNELNLTLYLYGTSCCHLCEEAAALLQNLEIDYSSVDITDDEELLQRYGLKIPVLYRADTQTELCWPFSSDEVLVLIKNK